MRQVTRARVSLSWFALNTRALIAPATGETHWAVGRSLAWRALFDQVRGNQAAPLDGRTLQPPWPLYQNGARERAMWNHYATNDPTTRVSTRTAWNNLLPIRLGPSTRLRADPWRAVLHECVYPHGVGCVMDLEFARPAPPTDLANFCNEAVSFVTTPQHWSGSAPPATINDVATRTVRRLARTVFGGPADHPLDPYSVTTIVQGATDQPSVDAALKQAGLALAGWRADWASADVTSSPDVTAFGVGNYGAFAAGTPGGWFVWAPSAFPVAAQPNAVSRSTLADLHRAMMWMGLQVDALGTFAVWLARDDIGDLPPTAQSLRRPVALALGRLAGGAGPVPGPLVTRQIANRGYAAAVTTLRKAEQLD